jgi:quercetin dioxygenase-like cupin family protein
MSERVVEDPVLRQRYVFRRVAAQEGAEVLQVEIWADPGGGVVPHIHPNFEESFEVFSGEVTFTVGREKRKATAGDKVVVPPGTRHNYKNTGRGEAHLQAEARPPLPDLQRFLEDAAALGRAGKYTRQALPKSFSGLLQLAVMARHYRDSTLILMPPPFVQRLLLYPLASLGERRGYRAGTFADGAVA